MTAPLVDVLLATFNGSRHLCPLLDSILSQSYPNWRLIVRDDDSSDDTLDIVHRYRESNKDQISIAADSDTRLGVRKNFNRLMECSEADYVMFCDQDDVWKKNKIKVTLDALLSLEVKYGKQTPLLVHSDLTVTDAQLNIICDSFWRYQHLFYERGSSFSLQLMQNVVTGNTVIINRSAKVRSIPIPNDAIMHDWWVALVVAAFGKIAPISTTTVLYRQHDSNDTGAKQWGTKNLVKILTSEFMNKKLRESISHCEKQAACFVARYSHELNPQQRAAAFTMAHLSKLGPIARRYAIWKHKLYKSGLVRNVGLFFIV
jgi:glycosyltransferase involved in cell wall biosynthesis